MSKESSEKPVPKDASMGRSFNLFGKNIHLNVASLGYGRDQDDARMHKAMKNANYDGLFKGAERVMDSLVDDAKTNNMPDSYVNALNGLKKGVKNSNDNIYKTARTLASEDEVPSPPTMAAQFELNQKDQMDQLTNMQREARVDFRATTPSAQETSDFDTQLADQKQTFEDGMKQTRDKGLHEEAANRINQAKVEAIATAPSRTQMLKNAFTNAPKHVMAIVKGAAYVDTKEKADPSKVFKTKTGSIRGGGVTCTKLENGAWSVEFPARKWYKSDWRRSSKMLDSVSQMMDNMIANDPDFQKTPPAKIYLKTNDKKLMRKAYKIARQKGLEVDFGQSELTQIDQQSGKEVKTPLGQTDVLSKSDIKEGDQLAKKHSHRGKDKTKRREQKTKSAKDGLQESADRADRSDTDGKTMGDRLHQSTDHDKWHDAYDKAKVGSTATTAPDAGAGVDVSAAPSPSPPGPS